ncbi:ferredoxin [Pseudonocardia sp. NPDC049635]|uniref:ferredoxin n=1 Tax=Pseudonocardia sp. NPDC049635 TaxID=3155506 RepID=UPI0033E70DF4
MPYVITDACLDVMDRTCVAQCPVDCIQEGERMLYIDPDGCIDCGACEPVCPQEAIHLAAALPAELQHFEAVNAQFHTATDYGPAGPGRAAGVDHPVVAALPRR